MCALDASVLLELSPTSWHVGFELEASVGNMIWLLPSFP